MKELKEHFGALMYELSFESPELSLNQRKFQAAKELVRRMFVELLCKFRGHDFTTNGCDYPDSGGEGFECRRCGISFTAWH